MTHRLVREGLRSPWSVIGGRDLSPPAPHAPCPAHTPSARAHSTQSAAGTPPHRHRVADLHTPCIRPVADLIASPAWLVSILHDCARMVCVPLVHMSMDMCMCMCMCMCMTDYVHGRRTALKTCQPLTIAPRARPGYLTDFPPPVIERGAMLSNAAAVTMIHVAERTRRAISNDSRPRKLVAHR